MTAQNYSQPMNPNPTIENQGAAVSVGSGEFVRLRSLTFVCVAQAGMALVMGAIGTVDSDTIIPACYFSFSTFVGAWLMRDKPNIASEPRGDNASPL